MTLPSHSQALGLSIHAHDPLVLGGGWLENLTARYDAYSHESLAVGSYWTASLTLTLLI